MSPDDRAQYLECMLCLDQVLVSVLCAALAGTLAAFSMRIPVVILVACAIGFYAISVVSARMAASRDMRNTAKLWLNPPRYAWTLVRMMNAHSTGWRVLLAAFVDLPPRSSLAYPVWALAASILLCVGGGLLVYTGRAGSNLLGLNPGTGAEAGGSSDNHQALQRLLGEARRQCLAATATESACEVALTSLCANLAVGSPARMRCNKLSSPPYPLRSTELERGLRDVELLLP